MTIVPGLAVLPDSIGRYRVIERIGRGAMGAVYSASDEHLGRRVAVKLMLAAFEEDTELRERFYREARVTGQLAHRNIVTVFDLGEHDGRPFIVMELLEGWPLNEYLRSDAAPSLDTKLDLMIQVCDGLQNAHQAGVIHRDIKPSNMFVLGDGSLKVLDFGVARLSGSNLTAAGMLLGTPEYMAPEQARGQKMDVRADVFSAAGVFYFMLAGRPPFGSRDLRNVLHAIINEDPPPLTDDQAPESLRRVLARGLAKNPEERYQRCADLRADLDHIRRALADSTARVTPAARERCKQIFAVIEERRTLGRSLGIGDIDAACNEAVVKIQVRYPAFADLSAPPVIIDAAAAKVALEDLQAEYNQEQAALAILQRRAIETMTPEPSRRQGFWRGLLRARGN